MDNRIVVPSKHLSMNHNVTIVVRDAATMKPVTAHIGHNAATNGLLIGIGHYLAGDGILDQGWHMLSNYVPKYISLGTMGLINQDEDEIGLPAGIGSVRGDEPTRFEDYMLQPPGYGADGYDENLNNGREYLGLGPMFANRRDKNHTVNCELVSSTFPRSRISYREIVPEVESEFPETIDVVFSAMISVGALSQFREEGMDHLFITEAGLWSRQDWVQGGDNGLLAGYRIAPTDRVNWGMTPGSVDDDAILDYEEKYGEITSGDKKEIVAAYNRDILKRSIIRVNSNQVVQVIWKIQLGGLQQLIGVEHIYDSNRLYWYKWEEAINRGL